MRIPVTHVTTGTSIETALASRARKTRTPEAERGKYLVPLQIDVGHKQRIPAQPEWQRDGAKMLASAPTKDLRDRKVAAQSNGLFPFLSTNNTAALEFGHILASSCKDTRGSRAQVRQGSKVRITAKHATRCLHRALV